MLFFLIFALSASAKEKKINLAPTRIEANRLPMKQTEVSINGKRFLRLEYEDELFYLRFQSTSPHLDPEKLEPLPNSAQANPYTGCMKAHRTRDGQLARVVGEVKISKVSSVYLEALRSECDVFDVRKQSDAEVGLKLKTSARSDVRLGLEAVPNTSLTPKASFNLGF